MAAVLKPALLPCIPENIPKQLREAERWAPWAAPWDEKRQKYGKVPHRADSVQHGLSNGSLRGWVSFERALAAYHNHPDLFAGIGYLMTGAHGVVGVDLDHCVVDGVVAPWAAEIIAKLDSYTEFSPSGTGLHVLGLGELDKDWAEKIGGPAVGAFTPGKEPGLDVYGGGARFLTMTGAHYPGSPRDLRPAQAALHALAARYRKSRDVAALHVLPLPDVYGLELPHLADLDLPPGVVNFLYEGPEPGVDRSRMLIRTGAALAAAGVAPEVAFALMVENDHTMEIALSKRGYDDTKAREYLWTHHCRRGAAIIDADRQLTLDAFEPLEAPGEAAADDLEDLIGVLPAAVAPPSQVSDVYADFEDLDVAEGAQVAPTDGQVRSRDLAPQGKKARFQFEKLDQFVTRPPARWIVKGLLPEASLAVLFGASGSGKTFFTFDLAVCVAAGRPWRGRPVAQGGVAYVVAEGQGGFRDRVAAYRQQHDVDLAGLPFYVLTEPPNMMASPDVKDLGNALRALGPLKMIVMDTYARVMGGGNENEAQDVNKVVANCDLLHRLTGAIVVLVHHSGKDASKGARGSVALRGAADVEIEVVRTAQYRAATVTKMKDGTDGQEYQFKLTDVAIGQDEDGEPITSCVVEHRENAAPRPRAALKPLTPRQQFVLKVLSDMTDLSGEGVHYTELKRCVVDQMPRDPATKKDNRGRDFDRDLDHLVFTGAVGRAEGGTLKIADT